MAHQRIIEPATSATVHDLDYVLLLAVLISVLSIGAVYIMFITDDRVSNVVVAAGVLGATIATVLAWGVVFFNATRRHLRDMEARIAGIEVDRLVAEATGPRGYIRRIK